MSPAAIADDDEIERLVALKPLEYARARKDTAKKFGVGVAALDAAIKAARLENVDAKAKVASGQGRPVELHQVESWPQSLNGATLLTNISDTLRQYVVVSQQQADALALWSLHTHAHDASEVSPKVVITSAQKRSGKTRLAAAMARVVSRPLYVSGIKPSALLRIIEAQGPTLLLDEIDAAMKADREMAEALRGIINSGFDRAGARYIMNVPIPGGGYEPREFSTWAPQLLSGIGQVPDTVRDRSIVIEMIRKRQSDKVKRLRRRDGIDLDKLGRKAARWANDNMEMLRKASPKMPDRLDDRAADAWEPLLAIAETAGGEWLKRAGEAAIALSGEDVKEDDEIATRLLTDIREIFQTDDAEIYTTKEGDKHIKSEDLIAKLHTREDRPWAEYGRMSKPISTIQLASLLRKYKTSFRGHKIRPGTIRIGSGEKDTAKGYKLSDFADVFERYLPVPAKQPVTPSQANKINQFDAIRPVTASPDVTAENSKNSNAINARDGVTALKLEPWETEI